MTIDECIDRMISRAALIMASPPPNYEEAKAGRNEIRADLHALVYAETERCAAEARELATSEEIKDCGCVEDCVELFQAYAREILATSPGKGDE